MRIIGPCLVILAFCLQGFVTYAFFWHGLEPISLEAGWPASIALSILGVFLLANALYNYTKAILTPGGIPPPYEKEQPELMNITEKQIPARQCTKCGLLKPPRAHHCSVCGVCIMKMDHHCPWINNCVGIGNYRFFFLFLLFLGLACLFIIAVFGFFFYDIIFAFGRRGTRAFRNCVLMSFMQRHPWEMDYRMPPVCLAWSFEQGGQQQIPQRGLALFNLFDGRAQDKMLFLAVVSHEEPPLAVFELLDRIYQVLLRYLGEVSEDSLRQNFSTVYLLLDEMIDSGLPFTTEMNRLESIIAPPSAIGKVVQAVSGSSTQVLSDVPLESAGQGGAFGALTSALGAMSHSNIGGASAEVWWRRQNVVYGSNEVYVDIVETISCICNSTGNMISGGVNGEVLINSKLSGVPEVLLTMRNPAVLQNVSFHPCVRLPRFQRDKALSFIPPDGEFSLASYWIPDTTLNLPFHFSVSVNYHSDHGKVQIAASPKLAVTMQNKQMLIDKCRTSERTQLPQACDLFFS
ncbi:AP-3 complex subunit mu (Adaptor protein complex AP-3 subunit mu) (Adaptor protein-3 mu-adaptin) (Adaptor-related protein complex 3 subunit mu) (At-muD-Ad) (Mu3-adaptin) (Protein ZIG SUPPRESSOR 4) [Durusdinium trenchii]|uniref:Palmitoyltransferase n=1 Tax=Durusdinium trenchii TaxID=1381693 RepID=A0ABP0JPG7_9DINO